MAKEWSDLPTELVGEILSCLKSSAVDILRFRSVCSAWREAATFHLDFKWDGHSPKIHNSTLPIFPNDGMPLVFHNLSLCRRSIFLLSCPDNPVSNFDSNWVIKTEKTPNGKIFHLYYPLSRTRIMPLPPTFPKVLDLSCIRIHELGQENLFRFLCPDSRDDGEYNDDLYKDNAALLYRETDHFMLLTIHVSGKLALFSSAYNEWRLINDFQSHFDDVIACHGEFYAVDNTGRAFVVGVGFDLLVSMTVVAEPVCGGDRKRLAVLGGELVLVDIYMGLPLQSQVQNHNAATYLDRIITRSRSMWFKVFRLDRGTQTWVELHSLGDYILFLGFDSSFSCPTLHLPCHKPNSIYFPFPENFFHSHQHEDKDEDEDEYDDRKFYCGGVFNLDDATMSFSQLFWPPPPWITSSSS